MEFITQEDVPMKAIPDNDDIREHSSSVCPDFSTQTGEPIPDLKRWNRYADSCVLAGYSLPDEMERLPVSTMERLPVHFYCYIAPKDMYRIHREGLWIPSLWQGEEEPDSDARYDSLVFTGKRLQPGNKAGARVKVSLRRNPKYENLSTGKKAVRVLCFGDFFVFCDGLRLTPDQCYFLDPYVCSSADEEYGMVQLMNFDNICHIVIPDGFTTINDCACSGSQHLETAYIGNTVEYIGNDSFSGCPKLHTAYIGASVWVKGTHTRAFNNCPQLRNVTMASDLKHYIQQGTALCREAEWPWFLDCPNLHVICFTDGSTLRL